MACYRFGPFELDAEARVLRRGSEPVPVAGKTLDTLLLLVENRGRLVDKEELLSRVWVGSLVEEANLTQTIFTVRKILGDSPKDHRYIATIAGRGYQFVAPVMEPAGTPEPAISQAEKCRAFSRRKRILQLSVLGTAVILAAITATWMLRRMSGNSAQGPEVQRFTSYAGVETMPAFSPDGREIAYVRAEHDASFVHLWGWQAGKADIYTKLVGAATELRLTNHPGADYYPAWSPDGQYIAFYRDEPGASGFYTVSALGGRERRITKKEEKPSGVAWLPDGQHLVVSHFFEGAGPSPLTELALDTGEEKPMTSPGESGWEDMWPAVSPDRQTLAFLRLKNFRATDVCFVAALASRTAAQCRRLEVEWPQGLAWTSSGDGIVVSAIRNGPSQLWLYRLKGGPLTALTSGEEEAVLPTSASQANRLAYVAYERNVNLWGVDLSSFPAANPANANPMVSSTRRQSDPAFSPDGHKLAYLSDRSGAQEIWVTEMETQTSTQLTHFGGAPSGSPSWSPDGVEIAFDAEQSAGSGIFLIRADGGAARRLTAADGENCVPSWSHDGEYVYFASDRSGEFQIWKIRAATGETASNPATQVTHGGGFRAFESHDGQYLYYAKGRGKPGLWRRSFSSGKEEPVLPSLQDWCWWALGPEAIYFLELSRSEHPEVHLKSLEIPGHRIRELGRLRHPVVTGTPAIAVSSDGSHLVYTQIDSLEADIMLMSKLQ